MLTSQQSGLSYAGKFLKNSALSEEQYAKLMTEIRIHRSCNQANIVRLNRAFETNGWTVCFSLFLIQFLNSFMTAHLY